MIQQDFLVDQEPQDRQFGLTLLPFQRKFLSAAFRPGVRTSCLSMPRGNGKSALWAWISAQCLAPGGRFFRMSEGREIVLIAGSLKQARIVFKTVRKMVGERGYRFADSNQELSAWHLQTRTRLLAYGANAKTLMGLGDESTALILGDEPASWGEREGAAMYDAIKTSLGKPGSDLRLMLAGTRAPAKPGNWWVDLLDQDVPGLYVRVYDGKPDRKLSLNRVRWANPLMYAFPDSREVLKQERAAALVDPRARSQFCAYRMNVPTGDIATELLTVEQWEAVLARPVPARGGSLIVGADMGGSRAWSSAVGIWETGRVEAVALVGALPDIADRERADGVEKGTYQRLVDQGRLLICDGKRIPVPADLVDQIEEAFGVPEKIVCDRFKLAQMRDACDGQGYEVEPRATRWSESTEDIGALRSLAVDGDLAIEETSRGLLSVSMAASQVLSDDQGSTRMVKQGDKSAGRDDVSAALVMGSGEVQRRKQKPARTWPPWIVAPGPRVQVPQNALDQAAVDVTGGHIVYN